VFLSASSLNGFPDSLEQLRECLRAYILADLARRQRLYCPHLVDNNARGYSSEQEKKQRERLG